MAAVVETSFTILLPSPPLQFAVASDEFDFGVRVNPDVDGCDVRQGRLADGHGAGLVAAGTVFFLCSIAYLVRSSNPDCLANFASFADRCVVSVSLCFTDVHQRAALQHGPQPPDPGPRACRPFDRAKAVTVHRVEDSWIIVCVSWQMFSFSGVAHADQKKWLQEIGTILVRISTSIVLCRYSSRLFSLRWRVCLW